MNKWLKLAIVAFSGLLIASFALGFTDSMGSDPHSSMGTMNGMTGNPTGAVTSHNITQPVGLQTGNIPVNWGGQVPGMDNPGGTMEAQMYMMQYQIMQLQQQLYYMMQMQNRQGFYPGPMGMPGSQYPVPNPSLGNMNNMNNMNNMPNSSMNGQSNSGGMAGMGMM